MRFKTSPKVGVCLRYQATCVTEMCLSGWRACPKSIDCKNRSVMGAYAQWAGQTTAAPSQYLTVHSFPQTYFPGSTAHTQSMMISSAVCLWSVKKRAFGGRLPAGSCVRTQQMGKKGRSRAVSQSYPWRDFHIVFAFSTSIEGDTLPSYVKIVQNTRQPLNYLEVSLWSFSQIAQSRVQTHLYLFTQS